MKQKKASETLRLEALRKRVPEFGDEDKPGGPFELLFGDDLTKASRAYEQAKGKFFGHEIWQSTQPYAGRALAVARANTKRGLLRIRELGQYVEGGSLEGHCHALWALLGRYDRLEEWPPWPASKEDIDPDLKARLQARNKLLRPQVRSTCEVRLALLAGEKPSAKDCKNEKTDDLLAAEGAFVLGDLETAEKRFRTIARNQPNWMTDMSKGDPRIAGLLGLARVARAKKAHAVALKHVDAALAIDKANAEALALGIETAEDVRLQARAKKYRTKLPKNAASTIDRHARDLYGVAIASGDDRRALEEAARKVLKGNPSLVSAREALAYAMGGDKREFDRTGLGLLFGKDDPIDPRKWSKLPANEALSPRGVTASERANALLLQGFGDEALVVLSAGGKVANDDPIRWLVAGTLFRKGVLLRSPAERKKHANDAWKWLEPLLKIKKKHDLEIPTMVLGIQIAHALGDAKRVLSVKVSDDARSYRSLTNRAHASVAPMIADALIKQKRARQAQKMIEESWDDDESERQNLRLIEAYERAGGTKRDRESARVFGDEELMRLSDEAWAHDQKGETEKAIAKYLEAAEAEPERASIGLGNAGNLLTKRGDYKRAWRYLEVALHFVSGLTPDGRASVLSQVSFHFRRQRKHATALPCAMLAYEFSPSADRALHIATDYRALKDSARSERWLARAKKLDTRHPSLT